MPLPIEAPENANPNAKPSDRLGYLGMALFVGALLMTPMDKAEAATIKVTNTNDNGPGSLRDAIDISESTPGVHDTIVFDKAVTGTIELYSGGISIEDPLTITGPGRDILSINAYGTSRILQIHTDSDDPVNISGLTFEGGYSNNYYFGYNGGALFVRHTNFHLSNCTVQGSYSKEHGGGIYVYACAGYIDNCIISDNSSRYEGGGIYHQGYHYYTANRYTLTVTNSTISGNSANNRDGGGIYAEGGQLVLTNTSFTDNTASDDGGAVGSNDLYQLDITNSTFLYNRSYGTNPRGGGGGLNILHLQGPATITGSIISQNIAYHKGGGITFEHIRTSEPVIITDSQIENNRSKYYDGGGIWSTEGNLTISDSSISENRAAGFGGGIFFDSDYALYSLTITNTTFYDNAANNQDGGAVYAEDGLLTFTNCTFLYNRADDDGGAIGGDDLTLLDISGCGFLYNVSDGSNPRGGGGAIWMKQFRGAATIQDSTFFENGATRKGGALSFEFQGGSLAIANSTLSGNGTGGRGGAIYQDYYGSPCIGLSITNSTISNNYAYSDGGGIHLGEVDAPMQITSCLVSDNYSRRNGGGLFVYDLNNDSPLTISTSVFHSNESYNRGGGICLAALYGGTTIRSGAYLTLASCTVSSNQSFDSDGGGLAVRADDLEGAVTIDRCRFLGNSSDDDGGGLFLDSNNDALLRVRNSTFDNNFATSDGGGIYFYCYDTGLAAQTLQIENSTISNNHANSDGGGIAFASYYSGFRINNSTISGNYAGDEGGGLYANFYNPDETCFINNCTIYGNYAYYDGGGIYAYGYKGTVDIRISSTILSGNSAGDDGDNWYSDGGANFYIRFSLLGYGDSFINNGNNYYTNTPYLYALANNGGPTKTHALTVSSPAIDAGINAAGSSFDQRGPGFPRNVGGQVDMGAFELNPDAVPPVDEQLFGFGPDSDGDGFSDDAEDAAGTDPNDPTDNPLGKLLADESQFEAFAVLKTQVTLNFAKPLSDAVKVTGRIPLADGTSLEGVGALLDIAGNSIGFTLDAKGGGVAPTGKIKVKPPKGGVASFTLSMKGNFQTGFANNADMQNETTPKAGVGKAVRVALALEGIGVYHADVVLSYKATVDKSGKAK